ncbi:class I SAM-dependent methyltransferase [Pararcticibacter amylolyticus]|uniref:SAM-dependent methyltransferase n=1 Tax=Pararcticibacter amylolyticus TaxID=2173175 RepID=A0A2U2PDD5_9SPHI|nr:class I SAM-dependent methyltransferase [Pararcticibacter amylolyticus]PWG79324.1 SAM-dependent methyltransferase [Pararcticibacter amylolyticus]
MNLIDSSISDFYAKSSEDTRLTQGVGPLEFERNRDLISRFFIQKRADIFDVGGGTGHYSEWLASVGHRVSLVDPVTKHIKLAQKRSRNAKKPFECILGEARKLPFADGSADMVILHGPLYHLQQQKDRIAALNEAHRVLRKGGVVLGFAITSAASTVAALGNGLIHHDSIFNMCREELITGIHHPPAEFPGILSDAFFHRPDLLRTELEMAGFSTEALLAVEGMAWLDGSFFQSWNNPEKKQRLLELLKLTEDREDLLSFSPHMMIAGRKGR